MAGFNDDLDCAGRYRKVYRAHVEPDLQWREEHFVKRYRLSKERMNDISIDFGPWSRTDGSNIGGGQSFFQQVNKTFLSLKIICDHIKICEKKRVFYHKT